MVVAAGLPLKERILRNVVVDEASGCWIWQRAKDMGYGVIMLRGHKLRKAHRVAYEEWVGPIPEGHELLHRTGCPRACCNPAHVRPGTHAENMREYAEQNTHCRRDHAYAEYGRIRKDGKRVCRECIRINRRAQREKHA